MSTYRDTGAGGDPMCHLPGSWALGCPAGRIRGCTGKTQSCRSWTCVGHRRGSDERCFLGGQDPYSWWLQWNRMIRCRDLDGKIFFNAFKWEFRSPNRNVFPVEQNFQTKRGYTMQIPPGKLNWSWGCCTPLTVASWVRASSFWVQLDITPCRSLPTSFQTG